MKKLVVCALCAAMVVPTVTVSVSADSKELVLYTWEGMFPQEILDGFEEATGIKIVYSNFDTDETMLEKLSMAKGGDYDVVIADDYIIQNAIEEGLVENWIHPDFPDGIISIHYTRDSFLTRIMNIQYHMVRESH